MDERQHIPLDAFAAGGLTLAGVVLAQQTGSEVLGAEFAATGTVLFQHLTAKHFRSAQRATSRALSLAGFDGEQLLTWAKADDRNAALLERAIQFAYETLDGHKACTIGRVLADALVDDATVDIDALVIETYRRLEAGHMRAVRTFVGAFHASRRRLASV